MVQSTDSGSVLNYWGKMKNILNRSFAFTGAALLAATLFAAPANAAPINPLPSFQTAPVPAPIEPSLPFLMTQGPAPEDTPELSEVSVNLTPEEQAKVAAGEPMIITVNSYTAMIEKIEPVPDVQALTSVFTHCSGAQGCFYGQGIPYIDYGFSGVGTAYGNWPGRARYGALTRSVSVCSDIVCFPRVAAGQLVNLTVTQPGRSFTIY